MIEKMISYYELLHEIEAESSVAETWFFNEFAADVIVVYSLDKDFFFNSLRWFLIKGKFDLELVSNLDTHPAKSWEANPPQGNILDAAVNGPSGNIAGSSKPGIFLINGIISTYGDLFPVVFPEVEIDTIGGATGAVDRQEMFFPRIFINWYIPDNKTGGAAESHPVVVLNI